MVFGLTRSELLKFGCTLLDQIQTYRKTRPDGERESVYFWRNDKRRRRPSYVRCECARPSIPSRTTDHTRKMTAYCVHAGKHNTVFNVKIIVTHTQDLVANRKNNISTQ